MKKTVVENGMKGVLMKGKNNAVFKPASKASFPSSKKDLLEKITGKVRREGNVFQVL